MALKKGIFICFLIVLASLILGSYKNPLFESVDSSHLIKRPVILLDAGHGGMDGGAVADDGTVEKEINLQIAKKLKAYLSIFGFEVIMSREKDEFIGADKDKSIREQKIEDIHNRLKMLEESDAQMLISIHQNKFTSSSVCGTQVSYGGNNEQSAILAESIQASVQKYLQPSNTRQVKQTTKSIYLLYHASKPAVMVECGFISNGAELAQLKNEEYQGKMCLCILRGILEYVDA